jgi:signal transduction histidine kinase
MLLPIAKKRVSILFLCSLAIVLLIGAFASWYVFSEVDYGGREHILDRAKTVAALIPSELVRELEGADADTESPAYQELKRELMEARSANSDIRFLYLMGIRDDEVFFYADSERPTSEDYSPPGQIYDEATDDMYAVLRNGVARVEGPDSDRWGTWISAYAPVITSDGAVVALLGIDLPAGEFLRTTYAYALLPLLIMLLTLFLIIAGEVVHKRAEKAVAEKEEFLSIASHEIRTPLVGLRWGLEQLTRDAGKSSDLVTLMHQTSVTLVARLNTLLDMHSFEHAKEREFTKDRIYIETFMREAAATLSLAAKERGITLVLPQVGDACMLADSQLLRHVFQNLIGNAIKYTRPNTTVTVSYALRDGMHTFRFKDEGEGIPPEEQDVIFTGYRRGKVARASGTAGTGLGLYMAKKAVLMHGGTISVDSKVGTGTTFTVTIPE